jgi:meso-butanediol dehydrogenase / (S,S)-butanediol dehydrogenase / diacetyl reductase
MVANAGIAQVKPLLEITPEDFDGLMYINLRGVFLSYQAGR